MSFHNHATNNHLDTYAAQPNPYVCFSYNYYTTVFLLC